ncbi:hypothetical protein V8F06_012484 [Rhypophila decipiens]
MAASPSGWALRKNGSCQSQEVDCGQTVAPYRVCCPHASSCPHQYNAACCPTSANCTESLIPSPNCANETWDLYDNDGYFCCLPGFLGYAAKSTDSNGCASPGYKLQTGEVLLRLIKAGVSSSSGGDVVTTLLPGPSSSAVGSDSAQAGGLSTGAKAGIGVGSGLAGLMILVAAGILLWRSNHRQKNEDNDDQGGSGQVMVVEAGQELPSEERSKVKEMDGYSRPIPELGHGHHHELEGNNTRVRVEAP